MIYKASCEPFDRLGARGSRDTLCPDLRRIQSVASHFAIDFIILGDQNLQPMLRPWPNILKHHTRAALLPYRGNVDE
jgi:hypothetical protein